jgi:hypothetical protein
LIPVLRPDTPPPNTVQDILSPQPPAAGDARLFLLPNPRWGE